MTSPITLFASSPVDGEQFVDPNAPITITLHFEAFFTTWEVWLDGLHILHFTSILLPGYDHNETVTDGGHTVIIEILAHPAFTNRMIDCVIYATDSNSVMVPLAFSFNVNLDIVSKLSAKSWCEGNRVDLSWVNPVGITVLIIMRSTQGFCNKTSDPGDIIYNEVPISSFSDAGLLDGTFYYYTLFYTFSITPPAVFYTSASAKVIGLSIKNYKAIEGRYVYNKLPLSIRNYDEVVGQKLLGVLCDTIQCLLNYIRGYADGLLLIRDPDLMPAGQVGTPDLNTSIIESQLWDMGFPTQAEFNLPALRRVISDLTNKVLKIKGTCPSLVNLVNLITGWQLRCDEMILPVCGVDRVFRTYASNSHMFVALGSITNGIGTLTIDPANFFKADEVTPASPPNPLDYVGMFVLDSVGTFACIKSWDGANTYTYDDPNANLRAAITGSGTSTGFTFVINSVNAGAFPWQFPFPAAEPVWGEHAFKGWLLVDHTDAIFVVLDSAATNGSGDTVLEVIGVATGTFKLSPTITLDVPPVPFYKVRLFAGRFSLTMNPVWDKRLAKQNAKGPWSYKGGSEAVPGETFGAGTLADVILWIKNVAQVIGIVTSIGIQSLVDSTQSWAVNQWSGYYVNPSWGQFKLLRIVGNTATTLVVASTDGSIMTLSAPTSTYVILKDTDADLYNAIARILTKFSPFQSKLFMKFE